MTRSSLFEKDDDDDDDDDLLFIPQFIQCVYGETSKKKEVIT